MQYIRNSPKARVLLGGSALGVLTYVELKWLMEDVEKNNERLRRLNKESDVNLASKTGVFDYGTSKPNNSARNDRIINN